MTLMNTRWLREELLRYAAPGALVLASLAFVIQTLEARLNVELPIRSGARSIFWLVPPLLLAGSYLAGRAFSSLLPRVLPFLQRATRGALRAADQAIRSANIAAPHERLEGELRLSGEIGIERRTSMLQACQEAQWAVRLFGLSVLLYAVIGWRDLLRELGGKTVAALMVVAACLAGCVLIDKFIAVLAGRPRRRVAYRRLCRKATRSRTSSSDSV